MSADETEGIMTHSQAATEGGHIKGHFRDTEIEKPDLC